MRASSQAALDLARERWEPVLREVGQRALGLGQQLFGVVDTLDSSVALRRALTEPSRDGSDKARVAQAVLGGKVDPELLDLASGLVRERWSEPADLVDAFEALAVDSVLAAAEQAGRLEDVEDETYRLGRTLVDERELRLALADKDVPAAHRGRLMESVLSGKVGPETTVLAVRAASSPRGRPVPAVLRSIGEQAAERRAHLVASVTSAVPLTGAQVERLTGILERQYGRSVRVHVGIDPDVVGGMRVQIGDDVIDATLASRLAEARRRLAG
ncbi:F0F1 ATP synthase subunit delta [Georgenia subflava]|uniref:ATP synthase subunit delta n=1 Tax=Georgenia subflava TaxID=1622177 RepID=A0A6N7EMN3_9MICO|nr:F0F1 ATP synthase subunit delta [Georgenia subflava]MPV38127.1 F0F1 ATP synthase subunit delta [Georgenia subflava]